MLNIFKKKYAFKFTIPSEYRIFCISPVLFCTGLMGNCGIADFEIKVDNDSVYINPENLDEKMAIVIAKEFIFGKSIVLNDIVRADLDLNAFPFLDVEINHKKVNASVCRYFNSTINVSRGNVNNLKRLMVNRGVNFEEVDEEDESVY